MKTSIFFINLIFITVSCSTSSDEEGNYIYLEEFYASYIDVQNVSKMDLWVNLTLEQRHSIWKQRFNSLSANQYLNHNQKDLIGEINSFMTLGNYSDPHRFQVFFNSKYDGLKKVFSEDEILFLTETLHPYIVDLKTSIKTYENRAKSGINTNKNLVDIEPSKDIPCDCISWCGFTELCCGNIRCEPTKNGCGLVGLSECTSTCEYLFNC